jgi:hypothetical protein
MHPDRSCVPLPGTLKKDDDGQACSLYRAIGWNNTSNPGVWPRTRLFLLSLNVLSKKGNNTMEKHYRQEGYYLKNNRKRHALPPLNMRVGSFVLV